MSLIFDQIIVSVGLGHLIVDMLNAARPVLLAYLSEPLGLSNASIGLITLFYIWAAAITQPIFGWVNDRWGSRWLATGGLLWMFAFFGLAMWTPGKNALVFLVLASFGSAAYHPAGAAYVTERGRTHHAGLETSAASFFFLFGQSGWFMGPIIAGPLLQHFGMLGLMIPAALALPVGLNASWQLRSDHPIAIDPQQVAEVRKPDLGLMGLVALALVAGLQAWAQQNMITFVPKFLADLGQSPSTYGLAAGIFMGGSAIGNLVGGFVGDRRDRRMVSMVALGLASLPLLAVSRLGETGWLYLLLPLAGALTGAVQSIVVVLAQRSIPGGKGLASGLAMGFMFASGALGTLYSGHLADQWGFPPVFAMTAGLCVLASAMTLFMKRPRPALVPA